MVRWDRTRGRPEPVAALDRIPERENGEPLVRIADVAPKAVYPRPTTIPWVRLRVAEMIAEAIRLLPDGVHLGITDAWRPLIRQQRIYDFMTRCAQEAFPHRDEVAIRRTVNRWVAPTGRKAPPGHCTGAAVDVVLLDDQGEQLDVWSPYSRFTAGPTFTLGLTEEAHRNRMLLHDTMIAAGFSNCRDEWWHYSYGDAGWAVRLGYNECFYGLAPLEPESLYAEAETAWLEAMKDRPNPFLEGQ